MKIMIPLIAILLFSIDTAYSQTDGDNAASAYKKAKIVNRAKLQDKRGTDSIAGKQYIYADDDAIDAAIAAQKGFSDFSIGSVALKKGTTLREINILIEGRGKKIIELDNTDGKPAVVNIGHVTEERGAEVKKIKSIIEMEVEVKGE